MKIRFSAAAAALALFPLAATAADDHNRGNVEAVDWSVNQIAIRTAQGGTLTYKVFPNASVRFTDCPECFPNPTLRDLAPPMYVHFVFEDLDVDTIKSFDVKEIGSAPRRSGPRASSSDSSPSSGVSGRDLKVKIMRMDERRGTFTADVAGRSQNFRARSGDLRDFREGDLAVITVDNGEVTAIRAAGRSARVTSIDERRDEVGLEVNGRERFYRVENRRMLERVKVGDRVTFDVETRNGQEVVTTLDR
jgi:Cu/Ag efflux protein CusF